ncbi:MAG: DUF5320 domain-containing protein [Fusobacteriaceae bacterium]|nr:DUF5320 domain-containing protein [Fusobacteriaceae bacterium]
MRRNGMGPNNEGSMTGRGLGNCIGNTFEGQESFYGKRVYGRGDFCRRNNGQGRGFFNVGLSEQEVYEARKATLEKELAQISEKLKEIQK